jgi:class 3 adenylate cyclase
MPLARRLLLTNLGIAPLDLGFTGAYIAVSGRWEAAPPAIALNLMILVVLNGLGLILLLGPLRRLGDTQDASARRRARRRFAKLNFLIPAWAFLMGACYCAGIFLAGAYTTDAASTAAIPTGLALGAFGWFAFTYGFYFAFYSYFATADCLSAYRLRHPEDQSPRLHQPFALKLGLVALALAAMPPALILQDLTWLAPVRLAQGLSPTDAVLLDLMATFLAAALSLFFVARSLLRPIDSLVVGFSRVADGDYETRLSAASDDELGELARRFNAMVRGLAERRRVESMFGKYVAPAVARTLLSESEAGYMRTASRTATSLFADIEGFTALSEDMSPDAAIDMLNDYFETISRPIAERGGAIVNLTGDGLHAVFNVPNPVPGHAAAAVACARDIQSLLSAHRFGPDGTVRLITRIGIHTGPVVAGSVGCDDRLHYTVYGDSVNVAARLEALNKELGTGIVMSEAVHAALQTDADGRALLTGLSLTRHGPLRLRGRRTPMTVFAMPPAVQAAEGA